MRMASSLASPICNVKGVGVQGLWRMVWPWLPIAVICDEGSWAFVSKLFTHLAYSVASFLSRLPRRSISFVPGVNSCVIS